MGFPRHSNDKGMRWIEGSEDVSTVAEDTGTERAERIRARLEVWNPISLLWERMTQPTAGGGGGAATIADGADVAQGATTDASSSNTVVGILKAIKAAITGTLAVSVGNFPGTQAVSGSVSVSNLPATQPVSGSVSVSNFPATQPVSGTFFQGTQPVSIATNTPDVTDRSARILGHVTVDATPSITLGVDLVGLVKDATVTSIYGTTDGSPAAYTVLDTLIRIRKTQDQELKAVQALVAAQQPPVAKKVQLTLLHRS